MSGGNVRGQELKYRVANDGTCACANCLRTSDAITRRTDNNTRTQHYVVCHEYQHEQVGHKQLHTVQYRLHSAPYERVMDKSALCDGACVPASTNVIR